MKAVVATSLPPIWKKKIIVKNGPFLQVVGNTKSLQLSFLITNYLRIYTNIEIPADLYLYPYTQPPSINLRRSITKDSLKSRKTQAGNGVFFSIFFRPPQRNPNLPGNLMQRSVPGVTKKWPKLVFWHVNSGKVMWNLEVMMVSKFGLFPGPDF